MTSLANIASVLERRGWIREIAGETDFNAAIRAIETMLETGRGLIVSGDYGVGKSALVEKVAAALGPYNIVHLALPHEVKHLTREWQEYWATNLFAENLVLDDLGAETQESLFGVRVEPAADFIIRHHAENVPKRLLITSNLTSAELDSRYGGRLYSRLKDLCIPLHLTGPDKRKWILPR